MKIKDVVADNGYHKTEALGVLERWGPRTYISGKRKTRRRKWSDQLVSYQRVYRANCRRTKGRRKSHKSGVSEFCGGPFKAMIVQSDPTPALRYPPEISLPR